MKKQTLPLFPWIPKPRASLIYHSDSDMLTGTQNCAFSSKGTSMQSEPWSVNFLTSFVVLISNFNAMLE